MSENLGTLIMIALHMATVMELLDEATKKIVNDDFSLLESGASAFNLHNATLLVIAGAVGIMFQETKVERALRAARAAVDEAFPAPAIVN